MTPEERIAQLEQEVIHLRDQAAETRDCLLLLAGTTRAFECAVLALLSSSKHPEAVGKEIVRQLQRLDSDLVFQSMSDAQLEGAQRASEVLIAALEASQALID
jgi:alkyl hydroperoxide reductase subunit AhpF